MIEMKVKVPESIKDRWDRLFFENRGLKKLGKNNVMVEAFEKLVTDLEKQYGRN